MPRYYLRTLGGLSLLRTENGADDAALSNSKTLLILAFLATRPGHSARRAEVAEILWPDTDRARALRALRQGLFFLSARADDVLERSDDTLTLRPDVVGVDLWEFDRAIEAREHARAIELARGPFAAGQERKVGSEAEHWIEGVNTRVTVALDVAYVREIERAIGAGDPDRAVQLARANAALNPLEEGRQTRLARTLLDAGDQVGALQALEEYRQVCQQALGEELPADLETRLRTLRDELHRRRRPGEIRAASPASPARARPAGEGPSAALFTLRGVPVTRTALALASGAALVGFVLILLLARSRGSPAPSPLAGVEATLLGVTRTGTTLRVVDLTVRNAVATVAERTDLQATDLPSPDGRLLATTVQTPQGWDLAVRAGPDSQRVLTSAAGDEYPVTWSPDGHYLVYAHRRLLADGRTQSYALQVADVTTDSTWPLAPSLESGEFPAAAWSPDGTQVAFTADVRGVPDVFRTQFDGDGLRNITRHIAWDGEPAWAPDGERVAFVSRRGEHADLYQARADGTDLQRLTRSASDEHRPVWLSATVVAMLVGSDEQRELRLLDTFTGQEHRVDGAPGTLVGLVARPARPAPWLDRLAIVPRVRRASPGQVLPLEVHATGSTGEPFLMEVPITWSVSDPAVARVEAPGLIRVEAAGTVKIVASAAGWRRDTLTLFALPLAEREGLPVFTEDWMGGLDRALWRTFGDPPPRVRPDGGLEGSGVFLNNGDQFFTSGAVTRQTFPLRDGLAVQVEGRMVFTGKLHQEFGIALYSAEHPDSVLVSGTAPSLAEFRVVGPSADRNAEAWIATPDRQVTLPVPPQPDQWHTYVLQFLADGGLEVILDGRMLWRSPGPVGSEAESVRVGLGFQSFETEILHGRLRIYAPPRWYLPEVTLDETSPG